MNIDKAILAGTGFLKKKGIKCAQLDSEILLSEALKKNREYLIINLDKKMKYKNFKSYVYMIKQRSLGKPIAYLTKKKIFGNQIL